MFKLCESKLTMIVNALLLITVLVSIQLTETFFYPTANKIYVTQGGDYSFGAISEFYGFECRYNSNTGNNGDYHVNTIESRERYVTEGWLRHQTPKVNIVRNSKSDGLCKVHVENATKDGPTEWTLQYDIKKNLRLEHFVQAQVNVHRETIKIIYLEKADVVSTNINILDNDEGFIQYLKGQYSILKCFLQFEDTVVDVFTGDVIGRGGNDTNLNVLAYREWKRKVNNIVSNIRIIDQHICGFRLTGLNLSDVTTSKWTLIVFDVHNNYYGDDFQVTVHPKLTDYESVEEVMVGGSFLISCNTNANTNNFKSDCQIYHPDGYLITKSCTYHIEIVKINDLGPWTCIVISEIYPMGLITLVRLVKPADEMRISSSFQEFKNYVEIQCEIKSFLLVKDIDSCQMISPIKEFIFVTETLLSDRYKGISSNFSKGICAIQIEKPLLESEKGMWICEILDLESYFVSSIFVMNKYTMAAKDESVVTVTLSESFELECLTKYAYDYCYIKSPNGTVFLEEPSFHPQIGECSLNIKNASPTHNGTWECFFGLYIQPLEEQIKKEVHVKNIEITSKLQTKYGESLKLVCNSEGLPLEYCMFIDPSNNILYLDENYYQNGISFVGHSLESGDCGMEVKEANQTQHGTWTCMTKIASNSGSQLLKTFMVQVEDNGMQTDNNHGWNEFGLNYFIVIGLVLFVFVVVTVIVILVKRRQ